MLQFEPDFSFTEPEPWADATLLQVAEVPPTSHVDVVCALHGRLDRKADWLIEEIHTLSATVRAASSTQASLSCCYGVTIA